MSLLKSCVLCSLKTGCFMVAFYTFFLSGLLLFFNVDAYVNYTAEYIAWSRIVSFIFSVFLFIAAISLLIGLFGESVQLLGVWIGIFLVYILYQIAFVSWNIYYYTTTYQDPSWDDRYRVRMLASIISFGVLIFGNILALVGVHSYREHLGGKGLIAVPPMA